MLRCKNAVPGHILFWQDAGILEYIIRGGGAAHSEEGVVVGRLVGVAVDEAVEENLLGRVDGDDEDGAAEAVDIIIVIAEAIPHSGGRYRSKAGVEILLFEFRGKVTAGCEAAVGLRLEAEDFVGGIFDADVTAVEFCHQVDHVARAVEGFDFPKAFGGDGAVEAEDADAVCCIWSAASRRCV